MDCFRENNLQAQLIFSRGGRKKFWRRKQGYSSHHWATRNDRTLSEVRSLFSRKRQLYSCDVTPATLPLNYGCFLLLTMTMYIVFAKTTTVEPGKRLACHERLTPAAKRAETTALSSPWRSRAESRTQVRENPLFSRKQESTLPDGKLAAPTSRQRWCSVEPRASRIQ